MVAMAIVGGSLIGVAAGGMLLGLGRIAGVSGIAAGALVPARGDWAWRALFLAGLVVGGVVMSRLYPAGFGTPDVSLVLVAASGLLVGVGTRIGNGCTSGHGVCGIGRGSPRSIAATVTFMATGVVTAFAVNHLLGGAR
jgi:uncharacterized protein